MNIAALAAAALLTTAPISVTATETNNDGLTVEYIPLDQVPDWYTTVPYIDTEALRTNHQSPSICMITEHDITCATDTQWKRATLHDRYTGALYKFIRKEPTTNQLATITDVYAEIKTTLGEHADNFNIEGIANDAYIYNPTTKVFDPSPEVPFWAAVEANTNTTKE